MNRNETEIDLAAPGSGAKMARRPVHLWIIGLLALLWNGGSAADYVLTVSGNAAYLSQFDAQQLAYFSGFPSWVTIGWGFAVWGALAGSLLLIFGKRQAVTAFAVSVAGMVATSIWQFALAPTDPVDIMGTAAIVMTALLWIVALALLFYAFDMRRRRVLR